MPDATPSDDWPHTSRLMPWLLAGFLAMLFLVPFDSIEAGFSLGGDSRLDRLLIIPLLGFWLACLFGASRAAVRLRPNGVFAGIVLFLSAALLSVAVNAGLLSNLGELELAVKKLVLLFSFVAFFFVVATTVRSGELKAFSAYLVALACLTSIGVIWEYRSGHNLFFDAASALLPGFTVMPPTPDPEVGAASIVGPTRHGLAATALLTMSLPFALTNLIDAVGRERVKWTLATGLILIAIAATQKKAALAVPPLVIVAIACYRPREVLRLLPLGLVAVLAMVAVTPGALGTIRSRALGAKNGDASTIGRTRDYRAIAPDVESRPLIGRGYGSYDPDRYRILDNDYLGLLIETGALGMLAFFGMIGAVLFAAHRTIRSGDPIRGPPALAALGATIAFAAVTVMFDSFSFAQAPYMFFFVAGVTAACAARALGRSPVRTLRRPGTVTP